MLVEVARESQRRAWAWPSVRVQKQCVARAAPREAGVGARAVASIVRLDEFDCWKFVAHEIGASVTRAGVDDDRLTGRIGDKRREAAAQMLTRVVVDNHDCHAWVGHRPRPRRRNDPWRQAPKSSRASQRTTERGATAATRNHPA